ncbi:MAG: glutamate--tRNA ligase, partial [Clostridia bacterium]|nr:glutamate--tRNA ligase [Clostridia bacterium]
MDYKYLSELLFPSVTKTAEDLEVEFPARNLKEGAIVSRMAPSPTGFVHLGNLVQGLTSERLSHQSGGVLFLRVEDTDRKREVKGAVETLIETLKHYGIQFDEGATMDGDHGIYAPYRQSQRASIYHVYAKKLVSEGQAYPCFCTEQELEEMHAAQEKECANFGYFGKWAKWRDRPIEEIEQMLGEGKPWVLRFRSTGSIENKIKFTDLIKGEVEVTENDIDHVLLKSDGIPTYHFAHAVDDHLMRTTHVVRGDEWLSTLPFHLQLFRALGFKPPKYCHIGPLMKMDGTSKRKLSKRKDPELALTYYKAEGFPVEAVYEYILTVLNSNFEDWRRANPNAHTDEFKFSYKKMNPAGSLFDAAKLRDVSKNVISKMTAEKVYELATEWAKEFDVDFYEKLTADMQRTLSIFAIGRGGNKPRKDYAVWSELKEYMGFFFDDYFKLCDQPDERFDRAVIAKIVREYADMYNPEDEQNVWFDTIKALGEKYNFASNMKEYKANPENYAGSVADVSGFLRLAVTGKNSSPDMYAVMSILGKEKV